jgi:hypothetical protein
VRVPTPGPSFSTHKSAPRYYRMMSQSQHGLTRAEYLRLRDRYLPDQRKIIFVLESPPISGLYFYNPEGSVSEPLFRAMMKDVLEITPRTKDEGLREFASRGFLLVDATYTPINHLKTKKEKKKAILDDFPLLLEDLRSHTEPETTVILVKANVCELLEPLLTGRFTVLNQEKKIPFPSTGRQNEFRDMVRPLLGL